ELLVLALVQKYREEGPAFVPRYLDLLSAGGSAAPHVLLARLDVDVNDPGFWELGLKLLDGMVAEAEQLAGQVQRRNRMNATTPRPPRYSLFLSLFFVVATFGCLFGMCGLSRRPEERGQELILIAVFGILAWVWGGAIGVWFGRIFPRRAGLED